MTEHNLPIRNQFISRSNHPSTKKIHPIDDIIQDTKKSNIDDEDENPKLKRAMYDCK